MTDKKALRKHFKELRLSMSAEERKQAEDDLDRIEMKLRRI